ncbi:MAG: transposase [Deltaproteobacteria bacterium]|nr:transposase [Deltaproteobacteria bacterium]
MVQSSASALGSWLPDPARGPRRISERAGRSIETPVSYCPENAGPTTRRLRRRPRHRRRAAGRRRRQQRPDPLRVRLREALRRLSHPRVIGQDHPPPPQPWRQPASQRRPVPRRHRPHALAPTHHRLRRPSHRRGQVQTRDHPLPQALPRPRDLHPAPTPHRRRPRASLGRIDVLEIYRSFNPYSEANFKTLKYCPAFPGRFGSIQDARAFCAAFFEHYNHVHRHAAIGLHTPASVHYGTAPEIRQQRAKTLDTAYDLNPARFRHRRPEPPKLPTVAWINEPSREALINNA